uniref:NADH:ubiquinone reductase (H(+)-translocating) n=1 Tax=Cichlidogyrus halli TaxID=321991 RepID=A0A344ANU9_9PLAT|nr:NADH dehydrogenase subunit 5 [Cichlidogyrus halli]
MVVLSGCLICISLIGLLLGNFFIFGGLDWLLLNNNALLVESGVSGIDILYLTMLFFCGFISMLFSLHYFGWIGSSLNRLIILFLGVMSMLIVSEELLLGLVWWEYLGVVSFFLILYYGNFDSGFAGNTTLVVSRLGDAGFFLAICFWYDGIWSHTLFVVSLFFIIVTKSAIVPFCSWLLEAMRAPTPVSCLVHSSTLVAAGVWFMTSYGGLFFDPSSMSLMLLICFLTVLLSGLCAMVFSDVKKIVALSTCNNISWCIIYYLLGSPQLCATQLVCHGVSKCLLFIAVGDSLASANGSQNKSCFTRVPYNSLAGFLSILLLSVSVSGFPFLGVFFNKHTLFNLLVANCSIFYGGFVFLCVLLSYTYAARLIFIVAFPNGSNSQWINSTFYIASTLLIFTSSFGYFMGSGSEEISSLGVLYSILIGILNLFGLILGYLTYWNASRSDYFSGFGFNDSSIMGYLNDFSLVSFISGILFNFRPEASLVNFLAGVKSISSIHLITIPIFVVTLLFIGLL